MPRLAEKDNPLLVFCSPQKEIEIYADDPLSYNQILTIRNPYEASIKFKLTCSNCSNYNLSDLEGIIRPQHKTDIYIQLKSDAAALEGIDTLRIQVFTCEPKKKYASKEISILIKRTKDRDLTPSPPGSESSSQPEIESNKVNQDGDAVKLFCINFFLSGILIAIWQTPVAGEHSDWPQCFDIIRPSWEFKMYASNFISCLLGYFVYKYQHNS